MEQKRKNHYEIAFENWLKDNKINYTSIDQSKRAQFDNIKLKSFDYFLTFSDRPTMLCEVKGRIFKGASFEHLTNLQCWVLAADIDGLAQWQKIFGKASEAYFIFVYQMENVDVDFDGRDFIELKGKKYVFLAVKLEDYQKEMKLRSPKWETVTLPADKFRECTVGIEQLLL